MYPNIDYIDYATYLKLLKHATVIQYGMYVVEKKRRLRGGHKRK